LLLGFFSATPRQSPHKSAEAVRARVPKDKVSGGQKALRFLLFVILLEHKAGRILPTGNAGLSFANA